MRVLVVDNYDSFVYNLVQYLAQLGADTAVRRTDEVDLRRARRHDGVLLKPRPGTPNRPARASSSSAAPSAALPLLGVCLGHQAIAGGLRRDVGRAPELLHGKTSLVAPQRARACSPGSRPRSSRPGTTRSRSSRTSVPADLEVTGRTDERRHRTLRHRELPLHGVQFHPESVLTDGGHRLLAQLDGRRRPPGARARGGPAWAPRPRGGGRPRLTARLPTRHRGGQSTDGQTNAAS